VVDAKACPDDQMILDVGPKSIALYQKEVSECATLVWNGPLGAFEIKPFDRGTVALARTVADRTAEKKLLSVAGGGDTVAALAAAGVEDKFSYVSSAGGAFLEWMEGKTLPGVAALIRAA
jgi:phosphoglycerate kinase